MAWLAENKNGDEYIYDLEPERYSDAFVNNERYSDSVKLPQGSIEKLIGRPLTWDDEPVEI